MCCARLGDARTTLMDTRLEVDLEVGGQNVHVGVAHFAWRGRAVTTTFTYSPAYLARTDAYAIDPALPLDVGRGHTTGLPGSFRRQRARPLGQAPDRKGLARAGLNRRG